MGAADVGTSSISFSSMKAAYVAGGQTNASGNSSLRDGSTTSAIAFSLFRNASFTNRTTVPGSGSITVDTHLKGKTFGSGGR
jgi:hypothetical protein|tara:strand:+ start:579 stop:824 length:246 start_codon:yes stop_codon:yes gene_type:complete